MPRKKNEDFYKKYGFTAKCENGKYSATCLFCQKELQNTALTRLSLHRQTCDQKRALSETQSIYLGRGVRPSLRITHEDADGGIDHGNEGKEIIVKIQEFLDDCEDDPDADGQGQQTVIKCEVSEHCSPHINSSNEDYQADAMEYEITGGPDNREYVEFLDEYKEVMQSLDNSANNTEENYAENRPKNNLASLKAEKVRAEIKQFRSKTQFLRTETENLKLERTLSLLKIQKLRLEIDSLRAQS